MFIELQSVKLGLPRWCSGKEPSCQSRRRERCEFDPWVRKIPWMRAWQSTPVFLPRESHGQRNLVDYFAVIKKSKILPFATI